MQGEEGFWIVAILILIIITAALGFGDDRERWR
jgi:hypothetical protein